MAHITDIYDRLTAFYRFPRSKTLRSILEVALTQTQAEMFNELPTNPRAGLVVAQVAEKLTLNEEEAARQLEDIYRRGLVDYVPAGEGKRAYHRPAVIEPLADHMLRVIGSRYLDDETRTISDPESREIANLWDKFEQEEWFRWERVDEMVHRRLAAVGRPGYTHTVMPAWKALEESGYNASDTTWDARQVARKAKFVFVTPCSCRTRSRRCHLPLYTCTSFEGVARTGSFANQEGRGVGKRLSPDEWLLRMGEAEELGMVHIGLLPFAPFACTCDTCCCNVFVPLMRYATPAEGLERAPFRAAVNKAICKGCSRCIKYCRFDAITPVMDPLTGKVKTVAIDDNRCFGCGQCVVQCKVPGAIALQSVGGTAMAKA